MTRLLDGVRRDALWAAKNFGSAAIQQKIHNVNCERLRIPHGRFHYDPVPMLRRLLRQESVGGPVLVSYGR